MSSDTVIDDGTSPPCGADDSLVLGPTAVGERFKDSTGLVVGEPVGVVDVLLTLDAVALAGHDL